MNASATRLEEGIFNAFIERGIINPNYRIKITDREIIGNSDYAKVNVEVYAPHKRKPVIAWNLCINFVRDTIHWDRSDFVRF